MVEMLGVLAIIGVLSIGEIQGYTMAMRKYRANEILAVAQKYATLLYSNCLSELLNNDEETHLISSGIPGYPFKEFLNCPRVTPFNQSGLGGLPSGVNYFDRLGHSSSIVRTDSGDIVRFLINLDSKELCQTILNILGVTDATNNYYGYTEGMCEKDSNGYVALAYFIMN